MRSDARAPRRVGLRIALLLSCPALIYLVGEIGARTALTRNEESVRDDLDRRGRTLEAAFQGLLQETARIASTAGASHGRAGPVRELLADRLEGTGVLDATGRLLEWEGTPSEPRAAAGARPVPGWSIRKQGFWTRLVVTTAPDPSGRIGLASFLLDSPLSDMPFLSLLPHELGRGASLRVTFEAGENRETPEDDSGAFTAPAPPASQAEWSVFEPGPPATLRIALVDPTKETLAWATIEEARQTHVASRRRALGAAAAAAAFVLLLCALFDWRRLCRSPVGLVAALSAIAGGRAVLLAVRLPSRLLPREVGSPLLFGSTDAFGLLGSPADLLFTSTALLAAALAVRAFAFGRDRSGKRGAPSVAILAGAAGVAATACLLWVCVALARNAQVPILEMSPAARSWGRLALLLGLLVAILAPAHLLATFATALREARGRPAGLPHAVAVALTLVPIAAAASFTIQRVSDGLALERIRSEYAPQVLEQSPRRRIALMSAVREAASSERVREVVEPPSGPEDAYAAYRAWVSGDLFHVGFSSALDLYDDAGELKSHFGFNLPRLNEPAPKTGDPESTYVARDEEFRIAAQRQRVVHGEAPVLDRGRVVGTVVGHVLEEPDDLPFLPKIAPYLAALGPGAPRAREDLHATPGYVLYDATATVLAATIHRPPAYSEELVRAAERGESVSVLAGEEPYVAVPLRNGSRLHLLLLPRRGPLEHLSTFVRLYLLVAVLVGATALLDRARGAGGIRSILDAIRGSFYRKLLASLLLASVVPVVALALFLRGYLERRSEAGLVEAASSLVRTAARVVEDYAALADDDPAAPPEINDEILSWLRRVIDQEILLYEDGVITATSRPELFSSGLLATRLPGEVQARVVKGGLPYVVLRRALGPSEIPVAYARVSLPRSDGQAVVAVPLVLQQREAALGLARVGEMLILASVLLGGLVAIGGSLLARTVARPVRELVKATGRIAAGDYDTRVTTRTRDEIAGLVEAFHGMGSALAAQRADLERRRDYMEALLRHASAGVVSTDPTGAIVTLNPAAETLLASPLGPPAVGETLADAVARNPETAPLAEVLRRPPGPGAEPVDVDLEVAGKPRRLRVVRAKLPDPTGGPPGTLTLLDDVTELMRSNQLAAWAEMARAIAHEIKNPLTPIQLSAEHLRRLLADRGLLPSEELEACIDTVVKQVRTLREIATEFSAYAKLPTLSLEKIDPRDLVHEAISPYRSGHPAGITIEERYEPAGFVAVDRRVMARALVNLVENAIDAMPDGGTLTVAVGSEESSAETLLSVEDTGPGLAPEVRARLFEPYFSTKSSGTGLGLAIVRRAVEAHGGRIEVDSRRGEGTVFRIRLPVAST